jgi:hypothetical protein
MSGTAGCAATARPGRPGGRPLHASEVLPDDVVRSGYLCWGDRTTRRPPLRPDPRGTVRQGRVHRRSRPLGVSEGRLVLRTL